MRTKTAYAAQQPSNSRACSLGKFACPCEYQKHRHRHCKPRRWGPGGQESSAHKWRRERRFKTDCTYLANLLRSRLRSGLVWEGVWLPGGRLRLWLVQLSWLGRRQIYREKPVQCWLLDVNHFSRRKALSKLDIQYHLDLQEQHKCCKFSQCTHQTWSCTWHTIAKLLASCPAKPSAMAIEDRRLSQILEIEGRHAAGHNDSIEANAIRGRATYRHQQAGRPSRCFG